MKYKMVVREVDREQGLYQVSSETLGPETWYDVQIKGVYACSCPARGACKHMSLAAAFARSGGVVGGVEEKKAVRAATVDGPMKWQVSIIKSALQKAVRRSLVDKALLYAKWYAETNWTDFVRRLFVIMCEDVAPHPDVVRLVECLGKKEPREGDMEQALMVVRDMAAAPYRVYFGAEIWNGGQRLDVAVWDNPIAAAVGKRSQQGGMPGDVKMLIYFANWVARTAEYDALAARIFPTRGQAVGAVGELTAGDIIPEAVDFHCYKGMAQALVKKEALATDAQRIKEQHDFLKDWPLADVVQRALWVGRSSLTNKIDVASGEVKTLSSHYTAPEECVAFCQKHQDEIDGLSRWVIRKNF